MKGQSGACSLDCDKPLVGGMNRLEKMLGWMERDVEPCARVVRGQGGVQGEVKRT